MTWQQGHATIVMLINRGHLEQISGQASNGGYLLQQGRQRIASANSIVETGRVSAYNLAYDGARQAVTALLIGRGLRYASYSAGGSWRGPSGPRTSRGPSRSVSAG